jgi:hypothetical protein
LHSDKVKPTRKASVYLFKSLYILLKYLRFKNIQKPTIKQASQENIIHQQWKEVENEPKEKKSFSRSVMLTCHLLCIKK